MRLRGGKKAVVAFLVLLSTAIGPTARAVPGQPEGWLSVAAGEPVGAAVPYSLAYIATVEGQWFGIGSWTLVIKRGCKKNGTGCKSVRTLNSTDFTGGVAQEPPGAIQPGDRVTGTFKAVGTVMGFGSATGCPGTTDCA